MSYFMSQKNTILDFPSINLRLIASMDMRLLMVCHYPVYIPQGEATKDLIKKKEDDGDLSDDSILTGVSATTLK